MGEARVPEVAAGRLDRHARLFLFALAAPVATFTVGHLFDGGPSLATDFSIRSAAGWVMLLVALVVSGLIATVVPLHAFARLLRHPAGAVRVASLLGVAAVVAGAASPSFVVAPFDDLLLPGYLLLVGGLFLVQRRALARWRDAGARRGTTLSVAIICKDEADRIGRLLEAVHGWADEVVVLDSGSTDGTVEVARRYASKVEVTDWPGYGVQKQRALERCSGEWVLSLDADEVPSEAFKREVDAWLAARTGHDAFKAHWVSIVFGGPIDFGADGRYHMRLLRRAATRFDGAVVHETAIVPGKVGRLESPVYHYTFRDAEHMERKFDEYAWLSARARFAQGRRATAVGAWLRGGVSFLLLYVVRLGVLDGWRGLRMAVRYARYTRDKYAFLRQLAQGAAR